MKYSLCLTNYNRYEMLIRSFEQVKNDDRIDEIVICDDNSDELTFASLWQWFLKEDKVTLIRNHENLGMYRNKMKVLSEASNDWCILFDSDNILDKSYLDALDKIGHLDNKTVYMPEFARPKFSFTKFAGKTFDRTNMGDLMNDPMGNVCMNTMNYVINKNNLPYKYNPEVKGCDSLWINYLLLQNGYSFHVTKGMQYEHATSADSEFLKHCDYNMAHAVKLKNLILSL